MNSLRSSLSRWHIHLEGGQEVQNLISRLWYREGCLWNSPKILKRRHPFILDDPVTHADVNQEIKKLKKKFLEVSDITNEVLRTYLFLTFKNPLFYLTVIFNYFPRYWKNATIALILKQPKSTKSHSSCKPFSLIDSPC